MTENFSLHKEVLDNLYEGVYFVDNNRKITFWNKGAERISGFKSNEIIGRHCYENILSHIDDMGNQLCLDGCPLEKTISDSQERETSLYLHHKDGHRVAVAIRTMPLFVDGEIIGAVEIFVDDKKQIEVQKVIDELKNFALYDQLTELPNRRYIDTFLNNRLTEFKNLKIPFSVGMIDIDHFKIFNDTYGHDVGDLVLKMVSKTFQTALRKNDFVGRWGGEEFIAVITAVSVEELKAASEKICNLVEKSSLSYDGTQLNVTISIGATLALENDTLESIIKRADEALYISKNNGRNRATII